MDRDIEKYLVEWKNDIDRAPLIIRGARQVGKSYTIEKFGMQNFDSTCVVNLDKNPELKNSFNSLDPKKIIANLELRKNLEIIPGKTLLFIDEIQNTANALKSLRYFKEDLPKLHVIGAGSLLEFTLDEENFSFPVGRVQFMYMKPFSFIEFLKVTKKEKWINFLSSVTLKNPISEDLHEELLKMVSFYSILGGMPKIIDSYKKTGSFLKCSRLQEAIITSYLEDFVKYSKKINHTYLQTLFEKSPDLIGKHVKYSKIDKSIKRPDIVFKNALKQLTKAGLLNKIFSTSGNGLPLRAEKNEKKFKIIFLDVGLLQRFMNIDFAKIDVENLINKGILSEQFVGQELLAYIDPYLNRKLYFWQREKKSSSAEVDYLFKIENQIIPIEVKSGKTGRLRSIKQFLIEKKETIGIRISQKPLEFKDEILSVPFYMIKEIPRLLKEI